VESPEFLPSYLPIEKFKKDEDYFNACRVLYESCKQILEILWNLTLQSADIVYTDALEYYASTREAAKRRIDGAETIYKDLEVFFKKKRSGSDEPTEKELKRDLNALLHTKRDGKIVVENIKPKVSGGKHKVIDERFSTKRMAKETEEEEIEE
jgi:ribosomal protein S24E